MCYFFTILLILTSQTAAWASDSDDAAQMLSRFPSGNVPANIEVLDAMGILGESGNEEHSSLLESMIDAESPQVKEAAMLALGGISNRSRLALRKSFVAPSPQQITSFTQHFRAEQLHLGIHERRALAYTVLVLGKIPANDDGEWRLTASEKEQASDPQGALRGYAQAAANGHTDAFREIREYGLDPEQLVLGLWTAWCPDRTDTSTTLETLITLGSIQTVRVLTNRAVRASAYHRAIALDALSQMLADGKLSNSASHAARHGLESGMQDPHDGVRDLARAALLELKPN
jgi:hypothetical protein